MSAKNAINNQFPRRKSTKLKVDLVSSGWTVTALASEIGYRRQSVSSTINGSKRYPLVLKAVKGVLHA